MNPSSKSVIERPRHRGLFAWLVGLVILSACSQLPSRPQKGGTASATLGGISSPVISPATAAQTAASMATPENPAATSSQTVERQESQQTAAPVPSVRITETPTPAGVVRVTEQFAPPAILTHTVSEKTGTVLAPAQKDSAREIAAKLASFRPVQLAGIGFLLFALACFHPVVRGVVGGGKTIPALAGALGVGLVFGPSLFVGHETLVLALATAGLLGAYLLARLHHKEGQLDAQAGK